MDLNKIKLNATDVIFVKLQNVFFVVWIKFETVYAISEVYVVFEVSEKIDNKIKRGFLLANLWNEIYKFLCCVLLGEYW